MRTKLVLVAMMLLAVSLVTVACQPESEGDPAPRFRLAGNLNGACVISSCHFAVNLRSINYCHNPERQAAKKSGKDCLHKIIRNFLDRYVSLNLSLHLLQDLFPQEFQDFRRMLQILYMMLGRPKKNLLKQDIRVERACLH